jgi:hypothetical protein
MKKLFITSFMLIAFLNTSVAVFAKRPPPMPVDKIVHEGIEYHAPDTLMGCVEAYHLKTGVRIWWKQIYVVKYNPKLETDVQDIYIKKMRIKRNNLIIEDERGRKYSLNLSSLEVKRELF